MGAKKPLEKILSFVDGHSDAVVADAHHDLTFTGFGRLFRARYLDESLRLGGIRVLDRVRQIILDAELDHRGAHLDVWHSG